MADKDELRRKIQEEINKLAADEQIIRNKRLDDLDKANAKEAEYLLLLKDIKRSYDEISNSLKSISGILRDNVDDLTRGREALNQTIASTRKLSNIASTLSSIRKGDYSYDEKKLKVLKEETKRRIDILKNLQQSGALNRADRKTNQENIKAAEELLNSFKGIKDTHKETNKQLGASVILAKGLDKVLGKAGITLGIADAVDETQKLGQEAASIGDKGFKPMSTFTKILGNNLKDALSFTNLLQTSILLTLDAMKQIDDGAGDMAKKMNITYSEALDLRRELTGIANASYNTNVNTKDLQESLLAVNASIGARVELTEKDLVTFTKMREMAGLTNDEIFGIQRIATLNNDTLDETNEKLLGAARAYAGRNKLAINEKQILKDISKASDALKLSLGGGVEKLAEAAIKARQFGLSLEQTEKISESLLQFESSIENELSAELLVGKNLNFERARALALNGQTADAAAEVAKQLGSAADFSKMNVIQQDALAKSVGMTRDELAKSLTDQVMLQKLGAKEGQSAQERYNELRAQGLSQSEIQAKLGKDANAELYEQQSIQERFNKTVEKLKEIFVNIGNALMPVFDVLSDIFKIVGPIVGVFGQIISFLSPLIKGLLYWKTLMFSIQTINKAYLATKTAIFTVEGRSNIAKKLGLVTDTQAAAAVKAHNMLQKESVAQSRAANFYKNKTLGTVILTNIQEKLGNAYQTVKNALSSAYLATKKAIIGVLNSEFLINTKNLIIEKGKLAIEKLQLGIETAINAIKRIGLLITIKDAFKSIASAAMSAYESAAKIPYIGWLIGAGAAAGVVALGASLMSKGDDILSPGDGSSGYGKRTLFGPEGAIQLNNKDTVIAGVDLFKKGDDVMSAPKGAISVSNKTSPKKAPAASNDMGDKFDKLISAVNKRNEAAVLIQ
jgi:hypothetical protein